MIDLEKIRQTKQVLWSLSARQMAIIRAISEGVTTVGELDAYPVKSLNTLIKRGIVVEYECGTVRLTLSGLLIAKTDSDKRSAP